MDNSGYVALARQVALERALDVTTNNIANLRTTGYKAQRAQFEEFLQKPPSPVVRTDPISSVVHVGVFNDFSSGAIERTGNPLDVAIQGDGFFSVATSAGTLYSRNGSFRLDQSGQITTQDGDPILDTGGSPLQLPPDGSQIVIGGDGSVAVDGSVIGQIGLVDFADPQSIVREGNGLYSSSASPAPATGVVVQGMVEGSNVQPIVEMTRMMEILRNFESAQKVMDAEHELAVGAIAKIGKSL